MKTDSLADAQKYELRRIDIWLYLLANSRMKPFETVFSSDNDTFSKIPSFYQYFFSNYKNVHETLNQLQNTCYERYLDIDYLLRIIRKDLETHTSKMSYIYFNRR